MGHGGTVIVRIWPETDSGQAGILKVLRAGQPGNLDTRTWSLSVLNSRWRKIISALGTWTLEDT